MSGQCTGWVLRHGPTNRAQRAVLVTIADAANRDGEHAHPGRDAMVEGSLYSAATVDRILADLLKHGWIEVESQGGGRGKATVYRVLMVARKPPHSGDVSESETSSSKAETSSSKAETSSRRASDQHVRDANGLFNGLYNAAAAGGEPAGPPSSPEDDPPAAEAWAFDRAHLDRARGVLRGEFYTEPVGGKPVEPGAMP